MRWKRAPAVDGAWMELDHGRGRPGSGAHAEKNITPPSQTFVTVVLAGVVVPE